CLGKMRDVTREGRTVVFVSHNLAAVRGLCSRALLLDHGRLVFDGGTDAAIDRYLGRAARGHAAVVEGAALDARLVKSKVYGDSPFFRCTRVAVLDETGARASAFRSDDEIAIAIDYTVLRPVPSLRLLVTLTDANQSVILRTENVDDPELDGPVRLEPGD